MRSKPPRLLPTLALAALWLALYLLWVAVRPADETSGTRTGGSAPAEGSPSTTTPAPFKPN